MSNERMSLEAPAGQRRGFGIGGVLIGLGLLALVAVIAFVVMSARRNEALRTDAVTSAASSLAETPPTQPPR